MLNMTNEVGAKILVAVVQIGDPRQVSTKHGLRICQDVTIVDSQQIDGARAVITLWGCDCALADDWLPFQTCS